MFPAPKKKPAKLCPLDEWILAESGSIVKFAREHYTNYDFHNPATKIKNFLWETFASHYMELVKNRAYNQDGQFTREEQDSARYTLNHILDDLLLLLAPILPFLTSAIYKDLRKLDIHSQEFPEPDAKLLLKKRPFKTEDIIELNGKVWKTKKDKGMSLRSEIASVTIPNKLKAIEADIKAAHKAGKVSYGKGISVSL